MLELIGLICLALAAVLLAGLALAGPSALGSRGSAARAKREPRGSEDSGPGSSSAAVPATGPAWYMRSAQFLRHGSSSERVSDEILDHVLALRADVAEMSSQVLALRAVLDQLSAATQDGPKAEADEEHWPVRAAA